MEDIETRPAQATMAEKVEERPDVVQYEDAPVITKSGFMFSEKAQDGDTALALFSNVEQLHETIDPAEERKLKLKIDFMILPYLIVCYAFFYIDKTTLSYAAIFGITKDLKLVGTQYSWLSSMFYFGFIVFSFPTNFMLQRLPVAKYLGANIFVWGVLLMCQAACGSFATLAVVRFLGGASEACADPAFMLITGMWYTRREQPIRMGIWYSAQGLGIAGGGLLGYGIGHIKGSLPSWRYEFIVIGALCCVWGIIMFIFLPDSPVTAKGLTDRERRIAIERLRGNQTGIENKHFKFYQLKETFFDYKSYLFFIFGCSATIPNGGISNFGTLIIKGFGFSTLGTTLMQIPYGMFTIVMILLMIYINDKLNSRRCLLMVLWMLPNIAGAFGLHYLSNEHKAGRYICYLLTGSYNAVFAMNLTLVTGNTAGHTKKVATSAFLFLGYCTGNISGPFFYKTAQAPRYTLGIWSMVVANLIEASVILLIWLSLALDNRRRDRKMGERAGLVVDLDATAFSDMTDRENPNFRYIY